MEPVKVNKIKLIKIIFELGKFRITMFVSFSTALGYLLAGNTLDFKLLIIVLGVFLLAGGASAFNEWREYSRDALMERTKNRPIPSGAITPRMGFNIALLLTFAGLGFLALINDLLVVSLGSFALIWYNTVYTSLKMKTALAIIPGSVVGAVPPAIGWVAGGGYLSDPQLWALVFFFYIWQIPHFWLLLMVLEKDYKMAGYPVLTDLFNSNQLRRITFVWIASLAVSCLLIPFFGSGSNSIITNILLLAAGILLLWRTRKLMALYFQEKSFKIAFIDINYYVLIVSILLSIDKLQLI